MVITGGAGFLGSHLSDRMLAEGFEVVCLDNLITGDLANIEHLFENPKFQFVKIDVTNYIHVPGPVDSILHFASPASPIDYLELPIQTLKVGSLGTHKALGLAKEKKARFLLASTSEVYGDPLVHPQREDYWGNVNPVGPRGVYDEAKRFAEAMTMAYHRTHKVATRIVRIFNSVLGDQPVVFFNDEDLHLEPIADYADRVGLAPDAPRRVLLPSFDPKTLRMELRPASALIQHFAHQDAFEIKLKYGRSVKVTGDHSVFVRGEDGRPVAKPVRNIASGDHVAIPARLPAVEKDRPVLDVARELRRAATTREDLWHWAIRHPSLAAVLDSREIALSDLLDRSGRYSGSSRRANTIGGTIRRWRQAGRAPLAVLDALGIEVPAGAEIGPYGASDVFLPNSVTIGDDLLWLVGFYLAEGSAYSGKGRHYVSFSSDEAFLERAASILEREFKVAVGRTAPSPGRAPSIWAHSKLLHAIFDGILDLRRRRIPAWILQLPLSRAKHVLEGFRCGDGTHSGKKLGNELVFDTSSEGLALDLNFLLLRFGIVASLGKYETTFRKRYGDRKFPFWRLTICALDEFDVLKWDAGVKQTLNARRMGDLVWSMVIGVEPCLVTGSVYDFSVPGHENFVAGTGVMCHNTYGPRMRLNDGRALPAFMSQALRGEDVTVFGDGSQTRSFCYVSDLIDGIFRLLMSNESDPVNIGNPREMTIKEFAEAVVRLTESRSRIVYKPLPVDDPKVRQPDIARARKLLGWEPKVPLEDGLKKTLDYFRTKIVTGGASRS